MPRAGFTSKGHCHCEMWASRPPGPSLPVLIPAFALRTPCLFFQGHLDADGTEASLSFPGSFGHFLDNTLSTTAWKNNVRLGGLSKCFDGKTQRHDHLFLFLWCPFSDILPYLGLGTRPWILQTLHREERSGTQRGVTVHGCSGRGRGLGAPGCHPQRRLGSL